MRLPCLGIRTAPVDVYLENNSTYQQDHISIRTAPVDVYLDTENQLVMTQRSIRTAPVDVYQRAKATKKATQKYSYSTC